MALKLNTKYLASFVGEDELTGIAPAVNACAKVLHDKTGLGNDFLGWLTLPTDYDKEEFARIQAAAKKIQSNSDILIVIGIGGSYLGARAVVEAVKGLYHNETSDVLQQQEEGYTGHLLCRQQHQSVLLAGSTGNL